MIKLILRLQNFWRKSKVVDSPATYSKHIPRIIPRSEHQLSRKHISGNMHGVPVAALLGYIKEFQESNAVHPILLPQNICFIGIRSFEPAEKEFLDSLGVKIFYMEDIRRKGLKAVFQEALDIIKLNTACYGISLDLDAIDPNEAPGVGTPEIDGIHHHDLCEALIQVNQDDRFVGAEIVEFNPVVDKDHKTEKIIVQLISAMFTKK